MMLKYEAPIKKRCTLLGTQDHVVDRSTPVPQLVTQAVQTQVRAAQKKKKGAGKQGFADDDAS